jgi:hypothetical protein
MTSVTTRRLQMAGANLFLLVLCLGLVVWRVNVRISSYRLISSVHASSPAVFDQAEQRSDDFCDSQRSLASDGTKELKTLSVARIPQPEGLLIVYRDRQVSKAIRSTIPMQVRPNFFRPPPFSNS